MKIDRLMGITMILLEKDIVSAKALSEIFEVSIRTIYRDIDSIELAGIPIITTPGANGGISILDNYKVDKNIFSNDELTNLFFALNTINPIINEKDRNVLTSKLKNIIPQEKINTIEELSSMISVDLNPWRVNKVQNVQLETLKSTIINKSIISISYSSNNKDTKRELEPYQLLLKEGAWYLYAYCLLRNDFRLFKLTRITNLEILEKTFEPRKIQNINHRPNFIRETIYLTLVADISLKDEMVEHCGFKNIKEENDKLIVNYPFIEREFAYSILLGYGSKCEVIKPEYIREEVKNRIHLMYSIYN